MKKTFTRVIAACCAMTMVFSLFSFTVSADDIDGDDQSGEAPVAVQEDGFGCTPS